MTQFVFSEIPFVRNCHSITTLNALRRRINHSNPLANKLIATEMGTDAWLVREDEITIDERIKGRNSCELGYYAECVYELPLDVEHVLMSESEHQVSFCWVDGVANVISLARTGDRKYHSFSHAIASCTYRGTVNSVSAISI